MRVHDSFRAYVLEQLAGLPHLRARAMFGGVGLYANDIFFGILATDTLYFKADDGNRSQYEAAGMAALKPYADKPMRMSYYQVPIGVLEDSDELAVWADAAIRAAKSTRKKPRPQSRCR